MTSMRFCLLAAVALAALAAAQTPRANGCNAATGSAALYVNTTSTCTQITSCQTAFTTCLGSTTNCTTASVCIAARVVCLNTAAANTTGCKSLNNLQLSLLNVANGQLYNASSAYSSCVATACSWLNTTYNGAGGNCTLNYGVLCVSPVNFVATLLLQGLFTAILADPTKSATFSADLVIDLTRALRITGITVSRMYIAGSKRQALQTLVVQVQIPGVSSKNAAFASAFSALQASGSSWATTASGYYTSVTGQTLTVLKIGAGSSSTAFSSIPVPTTATPPTPASNTTKAPTTASPAGGNTTASPGTKAPTAAPGSGNTTKAPATGSPTSSAASRSLLAAAAIAALSALLF